MNTLVTKQQAYQQDLLHQMEADYLGRAYPVAVIVCQLNRASLRGSR